MTKENVSENGNDLLAWSKEENAKLNEQRREAIEKSGKFQFLTIPEGTLELELLPEKPTKRTSNYGKEVADFNVSVDGIKYTWSVSTASPTYRKLVNLIANGKTKIQVIRTGQSKDTRYSLKAL